MYPRAVALIVAIISAPIIIILKSVFHLDETTVLCIVLIPTAIIVPIWHHKLFNEYYAEELERAKESKKRRQEEKRIRKELKKERREKRQ